MYSVRCKAGFCAITVCVSGLCGSYAMAQSTQAAAAPPKSGELEEVIVMARKRQESLIDVPVVETAIAQARQIGRAHV